LKKLQYKNNKVKDHIQPYESPGMVKFRLLLVHIGALCVFFVPFDTDLLIVAAVTFFVRIFAMEAGYHRYFSHKSYKTSRWFQFVIALVAASGAQRGPLWWAQHHREHHKYSDTVDDPHSPLYKGMWYAHVGWLWDKQYLQTDLTKVKDFATFPELVLLNKFHYIPPLVLFIALYILGEYSGLLSENVTGLSTVVWGFFLSTALVLNATFCINSIVHGNYFGSFRRYNTSDTTTNNWILSIPMLGASWHNNHHRYSGAARSGFAWWEIDISYYLLRLLASLGIVWDLRMVPDNVLIEGNIGTEK
jgi:stearoyl-CoA desaturase (delta-9 desaturase)